MKSRKWIQTENVYLFLSVRLLAALCSVLVGQAFFHFCTRRIFLMDGFGSWMGLFWGNIVFGLAAVALVLVPYVLLLLLGGNLREKKWYRVLTEFFFFAPVLFLGIAKCIDSAYFPHTYRLMSSEIFAYLGIGGDMGNLTKYFIRDYWPVGIGIVLCLIVLILPCAKMQLKHKFATRGWQRWVGTAVSFAVVFVLARGGFHKEFISLKDAGRYCDPKYSALVLNSGYTMIRTAMEDHMEEYNYMSEEEASALFNPEFTSIAHKSLGAQPASHQWSPMGGIWVDSTGVEHRVNVVILMMESFSQEYMGCYNDGVMESRTPFLDSLAQHSILYQGRSNGKKSIESLSAMVASIPTLMEMPFTMSEYAQDSIVGFPNILKKYGYTTGFYHGGYNGTMAFDKVCERMGFDEYLGQDEYLADGGDPKGYDGAWGISDEPFMQYAVKHMSTVKQPFYGLLFSISSHHPFGIPGGHENEFKQGIHPIMATVEYSDMALRKFFDAAKKTDWYDNTIFIITADHPGYGFDRSFNTFQGWYRTPMMVYMPWHPVGEKKDEILQQIDLVPTLIDYLGLDERCVCFGNSLFQRRNDDKGYHLVYGNGWYALNYVGGTAVVEGNTEVGDPERVRQLKAIIQQYSHRVRENKLTIKK